MEQPFSLMAEIKDSMTDVSLLSAEDKARIGEQKWTILGQLASLDPVTQGFDKFMVVPAPGECASRELDYWESVINDDEIHPQPVAHAAIRWLRANLPSPAEKIAIVHGDYRTGNYLYNQEQGITGILDWEMCHLGNPLEDLAWSLDPLWNRAEPTLAGRLIPHPQAIDIWAKASGLQVNLTDLHWWRVFVSVKALAIWISSSEDFEQGQSQEAILAMAGWVMTDNQTRILLDYLSPHSRREYATGTLHWSIAS